MVDGKRGDIVGDSEFSFTFHPSADSLLFFGFIIYSWKTGDVFPL